MNREHSGDTQKEERNTVTLVVPIYNMEKYLPRCLDSILAQTSQEFEAILVDDGSTDSSGSMCDRFATAHPERIRVLHKPNGGLSSARNAGIDAAQGDFITFPDPDDWLEAEYVETLLQAQREYQADLVCLGHYVDTDVSFTYGYPEMEPILLKGAEGQRNLLLGRKMHGFCWNKLYRMELIRELGLRFSNEMGDREDLFFTYSYLAHCTVTLHDPSRRVYHYYQRRDSSTRRSFDAAQLGTLQAFVRIMDDHRQTDPQLVQAAADELCTEAVNLLWNYENSAVDLPQVREDLILRIRQLLPSYLLSSTFHAGRKFQAILAAISPRLYVLLKNTIHRT